MIPATPSWPDSILVGLIFLYAIHSAATYRRTWEELRSGALSRGRVYAEVIGWQWLGVALLAGLWWLASRPAADLGLTANLLGAASTPRLLGAWAVSLLLSAYLLFQIWFVRRSAKARDQLREQMGELDAFLPSTRGQAWGFTALSFTAGICEEIFFRGFLLWWCQAALGLELISAAIISTVLFGFCHAYQGWQGMLKTGATGALLMVLRLVADSLWPAIVLHIAADVFGGWLVYHARPELDEGGPTSTGGAGLEEGTMVQAGL